MRIIQHEGPWGMVAVSAEPIEAARELVKDKLLNEQRVIKHPLGIIFLQPVYPKNLISQAIFLRIYPFFSSDYLATLLPSPRPRFLRS